MINRDQKYREMAAQSKYQRLYTYLLGLQAGEWRASFGEIESILGFKLPASARLHRPWWANQSSGISHSQTIAWSAAGWETAEVDMDAETLLFRRRKRPEAVRQPSMVMRGKYQRLYTYLLDLQAQEWRASFGEIESILGFELPASARLHRPWWANQSSANSHSQTLAWSVAGWETTEVDMDAETLLFKRRKSPDAVRKPSMVIRSKYQRLLTHLSGLQGQEWRASFVEVESILGFELPASARLYQPWWANQRSGRSHSHTLAWSVAGWETAEVDMDAETLLFRRRKRPESARKTNLDKVWPVHPSAAWPQGLNLRREEMYESRV